MTLPADKPEPPVTLTDPDMMSQDISKPLGQWFASRLSAREDVRRAVTLPADVARCAGRLLWLPQVGDFMTPECRICARLATQPSSDASTVWWLPAPPDLVDGKCPMRVEAR